MWYEGIKDYCWNNPGYDFKTGHFTQVVWRSTTRLGCGLSGGYVTCHYCAAGNVEDQYEWNVTELLEDKPDDCDTATFGYSLIQGMKILMAVSVL